jgi:predicted PurR-regulated permease PerM
VQGILLVAFIQAILIYVGLAVMGVEGAVIFAFLVLIIAIVQLPLTIITVPLAIYSFSVADTTPAIIFSVYMILVGLLDNFLKPILMGRGVSVPMIVVFVGSLGGMMLHGIIGLFVGAVVMAIGYQIYSLWLKRDEDEVAGTDAA